MYYKDKHDLELVKVKEVKPPFKGFKAVTVTKGIYSTVLINMYLSPEKRKEALEHEFRHILNGDNMRDSNGDDVQIIESRCHRDDIERG